MLNLKFELKVKMGNHKDVRHYKNEHKNTKLNINDCYGDDDG